MHILLTEYVVRVYTQRIVAAMESKLTLLGLLSAGPGHGYDLKRSWDHWFAASKPLAYGQVYATLARLVRDGLITQIETEPGAGPERKRYEVTDAGRQSVEQWLLTPVTRPATSRPTSSPRPSSPSCSTTTPGAFSTSSAPSTWRACAS